jgi:hypothetical protein
MPISPAGKDRLRRLDQALDEERRRVGNDRNRRAADRELADAHDDQSLDLPNIDPRKVAR